MRDGQSKSPGKIIDGVYQTLLAIFLSINMFLGGRQQINSLLGRPASPQRPVKPMEKPKTDLIFLEHKRDDHILVYDGIALATTLSISRHSLFKLVSQP